MKRYFLIIVLLSLCYVNSYSRVNDGLCDDSLSFRNGLIIMMTGMEFPFDFTFSDDCLERNLSFRILDDKTCEIENNQHIFPQFDFNDFYEYKAIDNGFDGYELILTKLIYTNRLDETKGEYVKPYQNKKVECCNSVIPILVGDTLRFSISKDKVQIRDMRFDIQFPSQEYIDDAVKKIEKDLNMSLAEYQKKCREIRISPTCTMGMSATEREKVRVSVPQRFLQRDINELKKMGYTGWWADQDKSIPPNLMKLKEKARKRYNNP